MSPTDTDRGPSPMSYSQRPLVARLTAQVRDECARESEVHVDAFMHAVQRGSPSVQWLLLHLADTVRQGRHAARQRASRRRP